MPCPKSILPALHTLTVFYNSMLKHEQFCTFTVAYSPQPCYICRHSTYQHQHVRTTDCAYPHLCWHSIRKKYKINYEHLSPGLFWLRLCGLCDKGAPEVPPACHIHQSPESSFHSRSNLDLHRKECFRSEPIVIKETILYLSELYTRETMSWWFSI
jgi:hypothetical protein